MMTKVYATAAICVARLSTAILVKNVGELDQKLGTGQTGDDEWAFLSKRSRRNQVRLYMRSTKVALLSPPKSGPVSRLG